jgi:hypothetical protein
MSRTSAHEQRERTAPLSEIGKPDTDVEVVTNAGLSDAVELEAFMHETVEIFVHKGRGPHDLDVIVPCVGVNQPIVRGYWTPVKRKFVEALARAHSIRYEQKVADPSRPEAFVMVEKKVPDYPFDVRDDSRRGKKWLESIYASL